MRYLLLFLEGVITFVSPCLLPLLPAYVSFFAGQGTGENTASGKKTLINAFGFVCGFTFIFVLLGLFAGFAGGMLRRYAVPLNIACGLLLVLFGLNFMDLIKLPFINSVRAFGSSRRITGFFSALLFGMIFSVSWTPCVGTFLGAALIQAAQNGGHAQGVLLLLCFSLGLGLPFILCALLLDRLSGAFNFIKKHYTLINKISGALLIALGILIATGTIGYLYGLM